MLQIQGIEGEAVVTYREPSIRRCGILSFPEAAKNMTNELIILEFTFGDFQK